MTPLKVLARSHPVKPPDLKSTPSGGRILPLNKTWNNICNSCRTLHHILCPSESIQKLAFKCWWHHSVRLINITFSGVRILFHYLKFLALDMAKKAWTPYFRLQFRYHKSHHVVVKAVLFELLFKTTLSPWKLSRKNTLSRWN